MQNGTRKVCQNWSFYTTFRPTSTSSHGNMKYGIQWPKTQPTQLMRQIVFSLTLYLNAILCRNSTGQTFIFAVIICQDPSRRSFWREERSLALWQRQRVGSWPNNILTNIRWPSQLLLLLWQRNSRVGATSNKGEKIIRSVQVSSYLSGLEILDFHLSVLQRQNRSWQWVGNHQV